MAKLSNSLELERLHKLRESGVLSESEFQLEKKKVLQGGVYVIQKKRNGCLKPFLIFLVLFISYLIWSNEKPNDKQVSQGNSEILANKSKQCKQVAKDLAYYAEVKDICFTELKLTQFSSNLNDNHFLSYLEKNNCPLISEGEIYDTQEKISILISESISSSPNKAEFCKKELPYFQKVVQKYQ